MSIVGNLISVVPKPVVALAAQLFGRVSPARVEMNRWLGPEAATVRGKVLATGAGTDSDHQGRLYQDYFPAASEYVTSDVDTGRGAEIELDLRAMPEINESTYDCVLCLSVLEHVDDPWAAVAEIHRILKYDGVLLLSVPFRHGIHDAPQDFWRFTIYGVRKLLGEHFDLPEVREIGVDPAGSPAAYCVRAKKKG